MATICRSPQLQPNPSSPLCVSLSSPFQQSPSFHFALSIPSSSNSSLYHFKFRPKKSHFLKPCFSLKETKKQQQQQQTLAPKTAPAPPPQVLRRLLNLNPKEDNNDDNGKLEGGDGGGETAVTGTILAGLLLVGVVGGFGTVGYLYKDQINAFLNQFSGFIEGNLLTNF